MISWNVAIRQKSVPENSGTRLHLRNPEKADLNVTLNHGDKRNIPKISLVSEAGTLSNLQQYKSARCLPFS